MFMHDINNRIRKSGMDLMSENNQLRGYPSNYQFINDVILDNCTRILATYTKLILDVLSSLHSNIYTSTRTRLPS